MLLDVGKNTNPSIRHYGVINLLFHGNRQGPKRTAQLAKKAEATGGGAKVRRIWRRNLGARKLRKRRNQGAKPRLNRSSVRRYGKRSRPSRLLW